MIEDVRVLDTLMPDLKGSPWVALDTEADSLHAYPEKLCLLQIACHGREALVDTLAGLDLAPLWKSLQGRELILHGSDYDLRLLKKSHDFVPDRVFDTMVASRLVGCRQFGLTDLVARYLGITLEKGPQKANWAKRPLTPRMETYALNDVRYLHPLAELLRAELREKGRLTWLEQTCRKLIEDSTRIQEPDPNTVWRVKGSHQLHPAGLAVLREIYYWREKEATRANKPPYFVLSPEIMVRLSQAASQPSEDGHPPKLSELFPTRMSPRRRDGLTKAISRGRRGPVPPRLKRSRGQRPTDAEHRRFLDLEKRRNRQAEELDIDPTLIASRATLMALAMDWEKAGADLLPWQRNLLEQP